MEWRCAPRIDERSGLMLHWTQGKSGLWRAKTADVTCVVRPSKDGKAWHWTIHHRKLTPYDSRFLLAHGSVSGHIKRACQEVEQALSASEKQKPPLASPTPLPALPCVYFVGADRGGKTTLSRYVRDAYRLLMLGEAARMVLHRDEDDFARIRATGASASKYQCDVFNRQLHEEDAAKAPYVSDRAFDNLAYASEHGRNFKELYDALPSAYLERLRASVVFFVKPAQDIFLAGAADPVRAHTDWDAVQRISAKVEILLQLLDIPHVTIAESIASRREELIDYTLSMKGHRKHG